jgi:hypothetical protein
MELLAQTIRERMPQDLQQYISQQKTTTNIPVCEQVPADVNCEIISAGAFEMKAYFPVSTSDKTVVFLHFPGGKITISYFLSRY